MFSKHYEKRLAAWHEFRKNLDNDLDPIQTTIDFYKSAPRVNINCDPWDPDTWPTPWQLLQENEYCDYCIILGICYTLQLTNTFKQNNFEIHISIDRELTERYYLLHLNNVVIGYDTKTYINKDSLPTSLFSETVHTMPILH